MKYYDRFCSGLSRVILGICSLLMVILLCCSALQVTSRYVFGSSITWTEEAARYCFIWLDMLGASVLVYQGRPRDSGPAGAQAAWHGCGKFMRRRFMFW